MRSNILLRAGGSALLFLAISAGARTAGAVQYFQDVPNAFGVQACNGKGCWTNYLRVTDIDMDGDLDVILPNANGYFNKGAAEPLVIYVNDGSANFTDTSAAAVGGYTGWLRQVALGDIDKDGDPDM